MPNRKPIIVIDPGHGGSANVGGSSPNNATGPNGLLEKNLTLDLARRLPALLAAEAEVVLTRDRDVNLALADRARAARDRNADLFLSLHLNGFSNPQTDGSEAWVARQANQQSRVLAQTALRQVLAVTGVNDRGVKESNFGVILPSRHAPQTAACLLEVAFLTNPAQAQRLANEAYRQRIAEAIAAALRHQLQAAAAVGQALQNVREVTFEPEVITIPAARRAALLQQAGWRKTDIAVTMKDFLGEPLRGHRVMAEFKAPGVASVVEGGDVTGGAITWANVWLKPAGTVRLMAVRLGTPALVPQGVAHYQLPARGPLQLEAVQRSEEVTVTAATSQEAVTKVGAKGSVGVDFKVFEIGGEVSSEAERRAGVARTITWKIILPTAALDIRAVGSNVSAQALEAGEWEPLVRQSLEGFLASFANIPVNVAGTALAVRPPYFINRDNERKRRALENRRNAPRQDREIFEQQRFATARVGKASINQLQEILQLAVAGNRIAASGGRAQPNADDCRQWLVRYGLGIDCSGFVTQTLNQTLSRVLGRALSQAETLDPRNINSAALKGGARGFASVARPDQLRPGDTMHKPGHIRIVTRVELTGAGQVKFMTAESSSVSDIGPTNNVWRYRDRAQFSGLQKERNRDWNGSGWENVREQDTFGRYNLLARFIEANSPTTRTQALAGDEGFAAYGYAQQNAPRIGWPDAPSGGRNAAETTVQGVRRIPLAGLQLGNQQAAQASGVSESAAGRAIVILPSELEPSRPVETLLHLHGYNIGYRQRGGAEPRDIAVDRIPAQLAAGGRNLIAVLPQGTTTSGFGSLDANAYLDEIFTALDSLGVWRGPAPQRGRVILSGHSGAGGAIAGILGERNQPRLPRSLAALLLFDAINVRSGKPASESGELRTVTAWVRARLDGDLAELRRAGDAAARQAYLQNSPRLRGYFTPGHYANLYRPLETALNEWFRAQHSELQALGPNVGQALRANYRLTLVSSLVARGQTPNHNRILGDALQNALATTSAAAQSANNAAEAFSLQAPPVKAPYCLRAR
jgi:N-acetylmuramoyl-L-alanine amidase